MSSVNTQTTPLGQNAYLEGRKTKFKDGSDTAAEQKDMFLKLMIAQMRNQDPTAPMDSKDMMAGITQMSQVEQFMNMSKSMENLSLSQSVGMVDKNVEYNVTDPETGEKSLYHGKVDHVIQKDGSIKMVVNVLQRFDRMAAGTEADPKWKPVQPGLQAQIVSSAVTRIG